MFGTHATRVSFPSKSEAILDTWCAGTYDAGFIRVSKPSSSDDSETSLGRHLVTSIHGEFGIRTVHHGMTRVQYLLHKASSSRASSIAKHVSSVRRIASVLVPSPELIPLCKYRCSLTYVFSAALHFLPRIANATPRQGWN